MRDYKVKSIRALDRGLEVLEYLQRARTASLHDLHRATGLPKASLTRIVATLAGRGLVWQRLADGAFMASHTTLPRPPQIHDVAFLVEVAAPILESLCRKVNWPSILAVPRLTCLEVVETNRPLSYFSHLALGPIGFRVNILRSATGRAWLAHCNADERAAMLERLAASNDAGNYLAHKPASLNRILRETRARGYGTRAADFGGHYDLTRRDFDDQRDSIAVPIIVAGDAIAAVNLTWAHRSTTVAAIASKALADLQAAAGKIAERLSPPMQ